MDRDIYLITRSKLIVQNIFIIYLHYLNIVITVRDSFILVILRRLVLRSIIFNTISPFYEIVFDENVENYIPSEYLKRQKTIEGSELLEFKNDLLLLLNFITFTNNGACSYELTKILGFFLRKPIQHLISDLYLEEKRIERENSDS